MRAGIPDDCLLDTDVLSYSYRGDTRAGPFRPYLNEWMASVAFMTVAELDLWALSRGWGEAQRERMARFLEPFPIVFADRARCRIWAELTDQARHSGRRIETADAWIAATALSLGVPLVTNNRDDFAGIPGLVLLP